jgi:hypothetical protein
MSINLSYSDALNHEIACPHCGGGYLHHSAVTAYWRAAEDAHHGLRVESRPESVLTSMEMAGNPSSRRDGIEIQFWCDACQALPRLQIAQHKGNTELQWATPIAMQPPGAQ